MICFFKLNHRYVALGAIAPIVLAIVSLITLYGEPAGDILNGSFVLDGFSKGFKTLLLGGATLILCTAMSDDKKNPIEDKGEYYYLFLMALLGAMFMASSVDFVTLFVGLELLSLSSYILVGIRKKNRASNEATMKYVINGGIGTAITLFGMSYLYGITGSTNIVDMQKSICRRTGWWYSVIASSRIPTLTRWALIQNCYSAVSYVGA